MNNEGTKQPGTTDPLERAKALVRAAQERNSLAIAQSRQILAMRADAPGSEEELARLAEEVLDSSARNQLLRGEIQAVQNFGQFEKVLDKVLDPNGGYRDCKFCGKRNALLKQLETGKFEEGLTEEKAQRQIASLAADASGIHTHQSGARVPCKRPLAMDFDADNLPNWVIRKFVVFYKNTAIYFEDAKWGLHHRFNEPRVHGAWEDLCDAKERCVGNLKSAKTPPAATASKKNVDLPPEHLVPGFLEKHYNLATGGLLPYHLNPDAILRDLKERAERLGDFNKGLGEFFENENYPTIEALAAKFGDPTATPNPKTGERHDQFNHVKDGLKTHYGKLFTGIGKLAKSIVEELRSGKNEDDIFEALASNPDKEMEKRGIEVPPPQTDSRRSNSSTSTRRESHRKPTPQEPFRGTQLADALTDLGYGTPAEAPITQTPQPAPPDATDESALLETSVDAQAPTPPKTETADKEGFDAGTLSLPAWLTDAMVEAGFTNLMQAGWTRKEAKAVGMAIKGKKRPTTAKLEKLAPELQELVTALFQKTDGQTQAVQAPSPAPESSESLEAAAEVPPPPPETSGDQEAAAASN